MLIGFYLVSFIVKYFFFLCIYNNARVYVCANECVCYVTHYTRYKYISVDLLISDFSYLSSLYLI